MKLSEFAKNKGISYKTAWRWWKAGYLEAIQTQTGTVLVNMEATEEKMKEEGKCKRNVPNV